jgi:hypothetical protein
MVSSRINKNVVFNETRKIDPEDMGFESAVYELDAFDKDIVVTLGKPKYTFSKQNIIYYPIYLVSFNNSIEGCLGIYEILENKILTILDEEGEVDINRLNEPLFFDFAEKIVHRTKTDVSAYLTAINRGTTSFVEPEGAKPEGAEPERAEEKVEEEDDEDDIMKLSTKRKNARPASSLATPTPPKEGIFTIDTTAIIPPPLPEETEEDANAIKSGFKPSSRNNWLQNFMENTKYEIHDVETNGDCFFAVVRDAFAQIGKKTTVQQLRQILVEEITDEIFQQYRTVYLSLEGEIRNYTQQMDGIKHTLEKELKPRSKSATSKKDADIIVQEATRLKETHKKMATEKKETQNLINSTTGNLANIITFEQFKEHLLTPNFWADTWAISTIEKRLNIKMVIFSEESFDEGAKNSVLNCGESNKDIQNMGVFRPDYYIITSYSGDHYRLVSYAGKKILQFSEVPYHIKILVLNKCFERNSGIYYLIQDFRNLKSKLDIEPDEGKPEEEDELGEGVGTDDMYDPEIVFMFHAKSENKPKPGRGSGEKIPKDKWNEFIPLGTNEHWRRKLDDFWTEAPFTVDGKKYASVEHYYQGAKFKNGFPDFALLFSLDSNSDISKDVAMCRSAGGKTGKMKTELVRPKNVKIDPDFYPRRNAEERERAVMAKFDQNMDLKNILLLTHRAKLVHFVMKNPPEVDVILMNTRKVLAL